MKAFLLQCAEFYFGKDNLDKTCFVFPNRRSEVFFRQYLKDLSFQAGKTVLCPQMFTINDFLFEAAGKKSSDKTHLLLTLYECYRKLNPKAEPLDDFLFWGDVVLGDFDDADKYLANPEHLFTNVAQFKDMQDSFDYLSPEQEAAIREFLGHFKTAGSIKDEFLRLWDILHPLYIAFNERLKEEGLSYEGAVYREIAESGSSISDRLETAFPRCSKYVFIGLNALSESEIKILGKMQKAGIAEFCWDWCGKWIQDKANRSSLFLSDFTVRFPSAFEIDESGLPETRFRAISVPSATGQAKILPSLLAEIPDPGINTAIVIPDENLLIPVLNSIPEDITDLNVTMGYPMKSSALWTLMSEIAQLQLRCREKDGQVEFYHKNVSSILSGSIVKSIASIPESELASELQDKLGKIEAGLRYYTPSSVFSGIPILELIFRAVPQNDIRAMEDYLQTIVLALAEQFKKISGMALELDFAREYYLAIGRLRSTGIQVRTDSYFRLLESLVGGKSVPFEGEPLNGLQIMGPLETRALDFDNVIILACNEGVFPSHRVSSSLIPPELRKGFGLPTYEYQDAVWAYYFYRLIHRASNVVMLYDSRTEVSRSGEESRYIKQLEMHFGAKVERIVATAPISLTSDDDSIAKTPEHISALHGTRLSATAIQSYLSCPAKFYYKCICRLREKDEVKEALDAGMLGNVFHKTMEALLKDRNPVTENYLKELLKDQSEIGGIIRAKINEEMKAGDSEAISGRNIIFKDMVERSVRKVLERDLELLKSYGRDSFRIEGIEKKLETEIDGFTFTGTIDRLDSFSSDEIRIVDYKTGKVSDEDFIINDGNAESIVSDLFNPECVNKPKIALQLYLYDRFVQENGLNKGRKILNSIYQTNRLFIKEVENVELCGSFQAKMKEALSECLKEISDTGKDWKKNINSCQWCDYKDICGR